MIDIFKRRTRLLLAVLLAVAIILPGCIPVRVTGSGNVVSRTYNLADFTKLQISYGFTAEVKASSGYNIEVTTDDNLFNYVNVKKNGDTLSISTKPGSYERSQLTATIMMPVLHSIELHDGGRTNINGFNSSDDLSIKLSDGTKLLGTLTAGNVDIALTDGSRVELEGSARDIKIISHNGSHADLSKFTVANTDLNIGDGGTVSINVTGTLNANLSAGSHVTYTGNPTMGSIRLSSGATLDKED